MLGVRLASQVIVLYHLRLVLTAREVAWRHPRWERLQGRRYGRRAQ